MGAGAEQRQAGILVGGEVSFQVRKLLETVQVLLERRKSFEGVGNEPTMPVESLVEKEVHVGQTFPGNPVAICEIVRPQPQDPHNLLLVKFAGFREIGMQYSQSETIAEVPYLVLQEVKPCSFIIRPAIGRNSS